MQNVKWERINNKANKEDRINSYNILDKKDIQLLVEFCVGKIIGRLATKTEKNRWDEVEKLVYVLFLKCEMKQLQSRKMTKTLMRRIRFELSDQ